MSGFHRNFRKNPLPVSNASGLPASKRPRIGSSSAKDSGCSGMEDDDDPFADDDITGEEWEFIASQAEIKLTQEQSIQPRSITNGHKSNNLVNGTSFKAPVPRPSSSKNTSNRNTNSNSVLVKELQEKLAIYEKNVKELEQSYKRKDGETMVLRDRLSTAEKHLTQEKMKILELQNRHDQAEAEQANHMQKEIEKFKDQVQFKQAEILESQNLIRNLEAKNKLLEQKKAESRTLSTSSSLGGARSSDAEWSGTQDLNHSAAKKIRLVKPESPRVSSSSLSSKAEFSDDPLGRKKGAKPSKQTSSPQKLSAEKPARITSKLTLKSKYISKDFSDRSVARELLCAESSAGRLDESKGGRSPYLDLLKSADPIENIKTMDCLRKLLMTHEEEKIFGNLCQTMRCDVSCSKDVPTELLDLLENLLSTYLNLQDSLSKGRIASQDTSSFHTAPSEQPSTSTAVRTAVPAKFAPPDRPKICKRAYTASQVLLILVTNSQKMTLHIVNDNVILLSKLLKLCDSERWHPALELHTDITNTALGIIAQLAKSSKDESQFERFSPFVKAEILQPLLAQRRVELKHGTVDALIYLIRHPVFASVLAREDSQTGSPSLLCHICDLACLECPKDVLDSAWLIFTDKIVTLLSILTAKHESILKEHSCFCEVYHAADILLYNQLLLWKNDHERNFKRMQLIKSALCLLHSCANIYSDGIPGSRRDHRHQFTLIYLEEFLAKAGDEASFWSQELTRIVKSEVKGLFEETETMS